MRSLAFIFSIFLFFISTDATAGLATSSSRIIYEEGTREKTLIIANINDYPIVVQAWFDDGSGNPEYEKSPFVILPAVFRMQPACIQSLRVFYNGAALPSNKESVVWLNLYEIPGVKKEGADAHAKLDFAMNTQLKVFYRPKGLQKIKLQDLVKKLKFSIERQDAKAVLVCENSSAYHLSFAQISLVYQGEKTNIIQEMDMMSSPLSKRRYMLESSIDGFEYIDFSLIGDDGHIYHGKVDRNGVVIDGF
ncbi:molecular chaperone [Acinetobacter vivianii]|uniref:fimbrial biogenesis chaperone n=1 Tax=Acinetobacter vivianii TaxID=1776742 RepID=UPI002DB5FC6E|nr:molecular chaperone [Acinetobacter vivianii]MEB6666720.1 molecular chaperone [Acinetobacter vivianii]